VTFYDTSDSSDRLPSNEGKNPSTIQLCDGCEPLTPNELYALYSLTGEHPAADEVVSSVRRKLSHTLIDAGEAGVKADAEYADEWFVAKGHRIWDGRPPLQGGDDD
jgi:hypothetical protein